MEEVFTQEANAKDLAEKRMKKDSETGSGNYFVITIEDPTKTKKYKKFCTKKLYETTHYLHVTGYDVVVTGKKPQKSFKEIVQEAEQGSVKFKNVMIPWARVIEIEQIKL